MSGVNNRKRKRWPGTRLQASWLIIKRCYGGEKAAWEAAAAAQSIRGKYAHLNVTVDDYLRDKHEEIERERLREGEPQL